MQWFLQHRRPFIVAVHILFAALTNFLAFWLRFDGRITAEQMTLWGGMLPWLLALRGLTFMLFRLYQGLWRYTGIWDLRNIIAAVLTSTLAFGAVVYWGFGLTTYPRSVLVVDTVLLICCLGGLRLGRRLSRELGSHAQGKRVLVYGAGDAGAMIVRDMKSDSASIYTPVGFVDDDPANVGQRIHGVRVLGTRHAIAQILSRVHPDEIWVVMPSVGPATIRDIVAVLQPFKVPIKTLPSLRDIVGHRATVAQIRNLAVEDLLERVPVGLDSHAVQPLIAGKRVLVTGAGGSIGSELCRQLAALQPGILLLYERYENSLYALDHDLAHQHPALDFRCVIGDVTDVQRVNLIMAEYRPEIIFHAAAHKHVPLMELNPCEAVKNNIVGTRTVAEAAAQYGAECFVLISTDKAVNPTSVMGAAKRVAELLIQDIAQRSRTRFMAVRFGNVLGSNGSVVPLFLAQISTGGPVTVTHPEVRRYFMLIPEAVHLVLQAAALGQGGAVYVLEMGEQIKVLDMARNLIRLAGYVPEQEIPIAIVGLRPGEKLFEELVEAHEHLRPSGVEKIFLVQTGDLPKPDWLAQTIGQLESLAHQGAAKEVIECLCQLVPTYQPQLSAGAEDSHEYPGYPTRHCGPCRESGADARAATS